ncbi:16S rRNA (guanine(527)-N(7))-methyltransferase RsmG [candidate division WOR-3 bacterium JGI_Cruoil_03_44_89]|uniref:Ribosomal RNA small subunit methyltransferase G n=1 Tax=candidate division WOR-3 bacterium JGI_Cruoil_03_44_89 TaxID=1973748 RepID=A0A235BN77_UNCW3|nr:MAG: 16S rRNA (guanine(527)-N(7))-methyltransferase RsmG [candidate division WOR-3 bacterium JGI_Cruoil_03_44_89]
MESEIVRLKEGLERIKLRADEDTIRRLYTYYQLILKWNEKVNLVSRDERDIVKRHILDSLSIYYSIKGTDLLDFGSGAGFPGIPLKILNNDLSLDILEAKKKKAVFLREVRRGLELRDVRIYNCDIRQFQSDRAYDVITARKVGSIKRIVQLTARLLKENGRIITFKGEKLPIELEEAGETLKRYKLSIVEIQNRIFTRGKICVLSAFDY